MVVRRLWLFVLLVWVGLGAVVNASWHPEFSPIIREDSLRSPLSYEDRSRFDRDTFSRLPSPKLPPAELRFPVPTVSMSSIASLPSERMYQMLLPNNTLRIGRHWVLSNGAAWHWSPYPNAYLDARTLSIPLPR